MIRLLVIACNKRENKSHQLLHNTCCFIIIITISVVFIIIIVIIILFSSSYSSSSSSYSSYYYYYCMCFDSPSCVWYIIPAGCSLVGPSSKPQTLGYFGHQRPFIKQKYDSDITSWYRNSDKYEHRQGKFSIFFIYLYIIILFHYKSPKLPFSQ